MQREDLVAELLLAFSERVAGVHGRGYLQAVCGDHVLQLVETNVDLVETEFIALLGGKVAEARERIFAGVWLPARPVSGRHEQLGHVPAETERELNVRVPGRFALLDCVDEGRRERLGGFSSIFAHRVRSWSILWP